ncbi:MAG: ATP-dependent RecD-like DNA helicase [Candidatus Aminicenantes bacterium]|nr:ATP-dependent RecD-like DNA helicase [Candidatus Aminicenantes bacterium]
MGYLTGAIDSIVYYSPENGYTVCRFSVEGEESITVVGNFPPLSPGEMLKISGKWEINPRFGKQFRVDNYLPVLPSSVKGVEKFLSSGMISGVGPVIAQRIMEQFGEKTMDVLSKDPDRLREVEGIADKKIAEIKKSWVKHEDIRELIIFLQEHNVSATMAAKLYKQYGRRAFHIIKTNPYQASHDIWGIGFKTADNMALKLGMDRDSPERVKAYIHYLLEKNSDQGHVFALKSELSTRCCQDLEVELNDFDNALSSLGKQKLVVLEQLDRDMAVYLPLFHEAEQEVARCLYDLKSDPASRPSFDVDKAVKQIEAKSHIDFTGEQTRAVKQSLNRKILVITGGPGTGKTTIVKAIVSIFEKCEKSIVLAAPTGRAAKRLSESTGKQAKTIHRTLEYISKTGQFRRNQNHPLDGDVLLVDEFSMVDLLLMHHLLKAVPRHMHLILVGDKDQLPSVGPGTLLKDIIDSGMVEVIVLNKIFRQEKHSLIVRNAHRINQGKSIIKPEKGDEDSDFYFIYKKDEDKVFQLIMNMCAHNIPDKLGLPALSTQIQVISPMYRGLVGVDHLNQELQKLLNPGSEGLKFGKREIRIRDKVMQIRNNYEKEVFNGDIGSVRDLDRKRYSVWVDFDGKVVHYSREEVNEIVNAYAISVHKSQGSEYQAVVMPLLTQHYIMLQRNLFYTALTRAKRLSCIIGSYKAMYIAIKNNKPIERNCLLKDKLVKLLNQEKQGPSSTQMP